MACALLLVDAQRNMLEGASPVPAAAQVRPALEDLLCRARQAGALIVHIQNDGPPGEPDEIGSTGWQLVFASRPDEMVVRKRESDAFFSNDELAGMLRQRGVERVVVAGMQSNYCVASTARGAMDNGFSVQLASGAHATYDEDLPAALISAQVEEELRSDGVKVVAALDVSFGS